MNDDEQHAANFLRSKGYQDCDIVHEPDGNVPPDLLLMNRIAIEVRRLNLNHETEERISGLEEVAISLRVRMRKLVESFGPPVDTRSWFVSFSFSRPISKWSKMKPEIKNALKKFSIDQDIRRNRYEIDKSLSIELSPSTVKRESLYVVGGSVDRQASGWVVPDMIKNIQICLSEKEGKVEVRKANYPVWWLILVDHISANFLDEDDIEIIRNKISPISLFEKVIIANKHDYYRSFEL